MELPYLAPGSVRPPRLEGIRQSMIRTEQLASFLGTCSRMETHADGSHSVLIALWCWNTSGAFCIYLFMLSVQCDLNFLDSLLWVIWGENISNCDSK